MSKPHQKQVFGSSTGEVSEQRQVLQSSEMRSNSRGSAQAKDRGLDQTLIDTFPCSDALSSIPDPAVEDMEWQTGNRPEMLV
jgi:hypothetical protein